MKPIEVVEQEQILDINSKVLPTVIDINLAELKPTPGGGLIDLLLWLARFLKNL